MADVRDIGEMGAIVWRDRDDIFRPQRLPVERVLDGFVLDDPLVVEQSPIVLIRRDVMAQLLQDAKKDVRREHGGVLLGDVYEDVGGRFLVVITLSILAANTQGTPVHLQFNEGSWQTIWNAMKDQGTATLLGWYHTHPGLGVFLSATDLRTQAAYFSQPWQIAAVIDPIREDIGFFWGREGKRLSAVRTFGVKNVV